MTGWIIRWVLSILVIILTASFWPGFEVTVPGAIFGSILLGIVNAFIRPIVVILTLPITVLTLGLFSLVINGLMLWLTSSVIKGFELASFFDAIVVALLISVFSFLINMFIKK